MGYDECWIFERLVEDWEFGDDLVGRQKRGGVDGGVCVGDVGMNVCGDCVLVGDWWSLRVCCWEWK